MDNKFPININCIIFSTNICKNKKYVLSLDKNNLVFPVFQLRSDMLLNIESSIIAYLKELIFVNELELIPQLITLNSIYLNQNDEINTVYGFVVGFTQSLNNCYWYEFDLANPIHHTNLLIDTIQKLK